MFDRASQFLAALAAFGLGLPAALACGLEWTGNFQRQEIVLMRDLSDGAGKPATLVANLRNEKGEAQPENLLLRSAAVAPNGRQIALLNKQAGRLRINDATGVGPVMVFEKRAPALFEWSADCARLAFAERVGGTRLTVAEVAKKTSWDVALPGFEVSALAFSADGANVLLLSESQGRLLAVPATGGAPRELLVRKGLHGLSVGPQQLVVCDGRQVLALDGAGTKVLHAFAAPRRVLAAEWIADGSAVFVSTKDEVLRLGLDGKARRIPVAGEQGPVHTLARSPDGTRLAAASDGRVTVLDPGGAVLYDGAGASSIRWARDSQSLLLTWNERVVRLETTLFTEEVLQSGNPIESRWETARMALLQPDLLQDRLVFTLYRVAGEVGDGQH